MTYTEIKKRNSKMYYYRVISVRQSKKILKKRIYLGVDLPAESLNIKENEADERLSKIIKEKKKLSALKKLKPKIIEILKGYNIKKASIFGSYARGEQKKDSDIDIIIEPSKNLSLFGLTEIKIDMEEKLKNKVDLLTYNSIHPLIKRYVKKDEIKIL